MRAIRYERYGPPDVIELREVPRPAVGDGDVLVRVRAAAVNPLDFHFLRGTPYLLRLRAGVSRPRAHGLGVDMAGIVEAVGADVTGFRPGDEVFGSCTGAFADYVAVPQDGALLTKPVGLTFEQAASVPVAGYTALQALRDKGRIRSGYAVLVNGASGGVGTFAVQIAKALGADVTGVCRTGNVKLVRSLGADRVVDYTRADYTRTGLRYHIIVDVAGSRTLSGNLRVLAPGGVLVGVGGPARGQWVGPVGRVAGMLVRSTLSSRRMVPMLARTKRDDLLVLRDLLDSGALTPVIDRTYPLEQAADAVRYVEAGHATGKVVVTVPGGAD